jgi:hypothetical protein
MGSLALYSGILFTLKSSVFSERMPFTEASAEARLVAWADLHDLAKNDALSAILVATSLRLDF